MEDLNKIKTYIANTKTAVDVYTPQYIDTKIQDVVEGNVEVIDGGTPSSTFSFLLNNLDCGTPTDFEEVYTPIDCGGV